MKIWNGLRAAAAVALVCFGLKAEAQFTTVTSAQLGGTGHVAQNATIYWQPVNAARIGTSGGQNLGSAQHAMVAAGAFSVSLPDALLSYPNLCYRMTVVDNGTGATLLGAGMAANGYDIQPQIGGPYDCIQPTGASWSLDSYTPPAQPPVIYAPVPGPAGPQGASAITGMSGDGAGNATLTGKFTASTVAAGTMNGEQIVGQGANTSIQTAVTNAAGTGSVKVPASVGQGEQQYPATAIAQPAINSSSYNNFSTTPVNDLRPLNSDVSLENILTMPFMDEEGEGGDTVRAAFCAKQGACKVALVGHSIAEGIFGVAPNDNYFALIAQYMQRKFPSVTFTFQNLSVGGTTAESFNNATFTCSSPSGTGTWYRAKAGGWYATGSSAFWGWISGPPYLQWPNGCGGGTSWAGNVQAFNPDIVIVDLVENEYGNNGLSFYASALQTMFSTIKGWNSTNPPTIILATDAPPNPNWASALGAVDPAIFEAYNEATRGFATQNNLLLMDADRYYNVLAYGIDPARRHYQVEHSYTSYPTGWVAAPGTTGTMPTLSGSGLSAYIAITSGTAPLVMRSRNAIDVTLSANFVPTNCSAVESIRFRVAADGSTGYKINIACSAAGANNTYTPTLIVFSNGIDYPIATGTSCTYANTFSPSFTLSTRGAKIDLWCFFAGDSASYVNSLSLYDYNKLSNGAVVLGYTSGTGNIGNEYIYYGNPTMYFTPKASIPSLLGLTVPPTYTGGDLDTNPNSYGGDGYHHPTPVGHDVMYLAAFKPVMQALARGMGVSSAYALTHLNATGLGGGIEDNLIGGVDVVGGPSGIRIINNARNQIWASWTDNASDPMVFQRKLQYTGMPIGCTQYPCVVASGNTAGATNQTNAYATVFTTNAAGVYRLSGSIVATTASTTAWVIQLACQVPFTGVAVPAQTLTTVTVGTTTGAQTATNGNWVGNIASGTAIQCGTFTNSGSNTGGVYTWTWALEKLSN